MKENYTDLANNLTDIIIKAGKYAKNIRKSIYNGVYLPLDIKELLESGDKPQIKADVLMHNFLIKELKKLNNLPIISEENKNNKLYSGSFWLVDPLDGSFCFSHNTGPYSILISLIKDLKPVLGIAHYPESKDIFIGYSGGGSYFLKNSYKTKLFYKPVGSELFGIITNATPNPDLVKKFLFDKLHIENYVETVGSPNFALTLSGKGDIMPVLHSNYEWDIAAYDAILRYSNKNEDNCIFDFAGLPIKYGKANIEKPFYTPNIVITPNKYLQNKIHGGALR